MTKPGLLSRLFLIFALLAFTAAALPAQEQEDVAAAQQPQAPAEKKDDKDAKKDDKKPGLALKPERKIEFTTGEATWLSLDVSPDGKTIVFELLGDIYTMPIGGGEAKAILTGMAFESQPKFSPDGQWIAFLSDRDGGENVWIAKPDGTDPKKLSRSDNAEFASPAWMPDGEYVIASRSAWGLNTYELWIFHVKGGGGVQITRAKPTPTTPTPQRNNSLGAVASPDGRYLYYSRRTGGFQYNAQFPLWQVARRDLKTGDEDILTAELGSGIRPLISPDGKFLVYGTRYETQTALRIRNLETGEDRWLKYPITRDEQESRFTRDLLPGFAFMPGGNELILTLDGKISRMDIASGRTTPIPFTAKVSQELGPRLYFPYRVDQSANVRARILQDPSQSPDGKRIVFSALTKLYVMDIPGGTPKRLTSGDAAEYTPAWSPDGQWVAYVTWDINGGQLWKVRGDGSGSPVQLTRISAFYNSPVWSPDGQRIVALRSSRDARVRRPNDFGNPPNTDLVWVAASGGDANLILPSRGLGSPHFSREADRVYVYSAQGLISLRYDGTDRRVHLRVTGPGLYFAEEPVPANDMRVSPDGKWVLAHVRNQLYVTALPRVGGDGPTINISAPSVPIKKLTDIGADYFGWADDGKTITWAVGPSYFRQPTSTVSFDPPAPPPAPEKPAEKAGEKKEEEKKEAAPEEKKEEKKPLYEEISVVVEVPRATPKGSIVLRGAKVITMKGDEVLADADVVVTDNRIAGVGKRGTVTVPAGARILDVKGATIVPGFIDTHAHWFEIRRGVLDTQNWSFLANLAYGVTAGLDVQTATNDMFAYQDLVDAGMILGPRAYSTGPGVFSDNAFTTVDEAKGVLKRYKSYYGTPHIKSYIVGNRKARQLVAAASKEIGIMPTTEGGLDFKLDLTHVLDGFKGNEHALPIVPVYKDVTRLVADSGLFYTPTLVVAYGGPFGENYYYTFTEVNTDEKLNRFLPRNLVSANTSRRPGWFRKEEYNFSKIATAAKDIVRAGGRVGVGAHGQLQGLGYHWELWMLQSGGMTPLEALRSATMHGAEALGLAQDLGSIEVGKLADLIILNKDPLADITNTNSIRFVMQNGALFNADTLDQVWPVEKKLPKLWWWDDKPKN